MTATPPEDNGQHGQHPGQGQPPHGQQPQYGQGQPPHGQQPQYEQGQQPPQYGQGQQPPQYGQGQHPPQYGQGQHPPQYGQGQQHPGQGGPWQQQPRYGAQPPQWGQQPPGYTAPQPMRPEDQRLWATLLHIGGIFFSVIVPIVGYLVLRDRGQFVREHARTTLNFHITMFIAYFIGGITSWLGIGVLIIIAVWILTIVFAIMGAVAANEGRFYKYPLTIEFVKH